MSHDLFRGRLAAFGTPGGRAFVVSRWEMTPTGPWCSILVAEPDGTRRLFAPQRLADDAVGALHDLDDVVDAHVTVAIGPERAWHVIARIDGEHAAVIDLSVTIGRRTARGGMAALLPRVVQETRVYASLIEWGVRVLSFVDPRLRTVHTVGVLRDGRREYHCATDEHVITDVVGHHRDERIDGCTDVGVCRFGFSDPPPRPAMGAMTSLRFGP